MPNEKHVRDQLQASKNVGAAFLIAGTTETARLAAERNGLAARVERLEAELAWERHRRECGQCSTHGRPLCPRGQGLHCAVVDAYQGAALAASQGVAAAPNDGECSGSCKPPSYDAACPMHGAAALKEALSNAPMTDDDRRAAVLAACGRLLARARADQGEADGCSVQTSVWSDDILLVAGAMGALLGRHKEVARSAMWVGPHGACLACMLPYPCTVAKEIATATATPTQEGGSDAVE